MIGGQLRRQQRVRSTRRNREDGRRREDEEDDAQNGWNEVRAPVGDEATDGTGTAVRRARASGLVFANDRLAPRAEAWWKRLSTQVLGLMPEDGVSAVLSQR